MATSDRDFPFILIPPSEDAVRRMSSDVRRASVELGQREARFIVDSFYSMQENRIRASQQYQTMKDEPNATVQWLREQNHQLEKQLATSLGRYARTHPVGQWMLDITGVGPILAAGLLAYIDIEKCPTVGHMWAYAGLDPTRTWNKGEKRPWNARLKTICWKLGESFVKVQAKENDYYGKVFISRKEYEWNKNLNGDYADQAFKILEKKKIGTDTLAYRFYSGICNPSEIKALLADKGVPQNYKPKVVIAKADDGTTHVVGGVRMLPPAHIHSRAKRYAVKLFLSHLHHVWYEMHYGVEPPKPYPIAHLEHTDFIPPPSWGFEDRARTNRENQ